MKGKNGIVISINIAFYSLFFKNLDISFRKIKIKFLYINFSVLKLKGQVYKLNLVVRVNQSVINNKLVTIAVIKIVIGEGFIKFGG